MTSLQKSHTRMNSGRQARLRPALDPNVLFATRLAYPLWRTRGISRQTDADVTSATDNGILASGPA